MSTTHLRRIIIGTLVSVVFLFFATILPRTTTAIFASPDETAVSVFSEAWTWSQGFRVPTGLPEALASIPGLHPRSMVQQGSWLVPVGFLGMPMIAALLNSAWQGSDVFMTAVLVLFSAYALFRLVRPLGAITATVSAIVYLSFPTVLLYANRGLFPNLPVVALTMCALWLLRDGKALWQSIVAGLLIGLAATIRPVELGWMVPWIAWCAYLGFKAERSSFRKRMIMTLLSAVMVCAVGFFAARQTYQGSLFGYFLPDVTGVSAPSSDGSVMNQIPSVTTLLPFGIHPRAMWQNIHLYFFGILGPWVAAAFVGLALWLMRGSRDGRDDRTNGTDSALRNRLFNNPVRPVVLSSREFKVTWTALALVAWTVFFLLLMYGQAAYADNINQRATIGNSFLRYLLPLAPLIAVGIGLLVEQLIALRARWTFFAYGLTVFFVTYGALTALVRDEEGVLRTRLELQRYERIRTAADTLLRPGTVILSERSDKIFANGPFVAVSPYPEQIKDVFASGAPVALFHRVMTIDEEDALMEGVVREPFLPVAFFENEALYAFPNALLPTP